MSDVFNIIMPIVGVIVGSLISYFTQKNLYKKQVKEERLKQHKQFMVEKLEIYGRILKASYEHNLFINNYDGTVKLNYKRFNEVFRPLFYEKLYLMDSEVVIKLKTIDDFLIEESFLGNPIDPQHNLLNNLFNEILDFINEEMYAGKEKIFMNK